MNSEKLPWEDASDQLDPVSLPPHQMQVERSSGKRPRKSAVTYDKETKIEVALEALKEKITQRELSIKLGVPQPLIRNWKDLAIRSVRDCFGKQSIQKSDHLAESEILNQLPAGMDLVALQQLVSTLRETANLIERAHTGMSTPSETDTVD